MDIFFVAIGGSLGSLSRFLIGKKISERGMSSFPLGTFLINISGALLLGILTAINIQGNLYFLMGDGFLGAFTTFSTFMYEGFNLFQENQTANALAYILGSLILGIAGFFAGYWFFI